MELSPFRKRLLSGDVHLANREKLLNEYRYFSSIAPKSMFDNFGIGSIFKKFGEFLNGNTVLAVVLLILGIPIIIAVFSMAIPVLLIFLVIASFGSRMNQKPEYKQYNYIEKIVSLKMKLFDEKLDFGYHYNSHDLVDMDLSYDDALVEARMVQPFHKKAYGHSYTSCTYDWGNVNNTDSFEYLGYKIYYEWRDDDGDTHEEVFYDGCVYKFHTSFTTQGTINIMSTKTVKGIMGGEKEVSHFKFIKDKDVNVIDTENHEFSENFDTIATYDEEAYRFLTPTMIETLNNLRKNFYFCICIKGNVMTVTVYGGYKNATKEAIPSSKPFFAPKVPDQAMNQEIDRCRNALLSVYELKDLLDPAGMYIN